MLRSKQVDDVLVVGFGVDKILDATAIQAVGQELQSVIEDVDEGQKMILTFTGVEFMSSAMLGTLVQFLKTCKRKKIELKVCSISKTIFEVFEITGLKKMFDIQKDEAAAMKSFTKKGWFS